MGYMSGRPEWSITEAAERCGVSRSTIRRYLDGERFPNADKSSGAWRIPLTDLLAAGLSPSGMSEPDYPTEERPPRSEETELRHRVEILEERLRSKERRESDLEQQIKDLRQSNSDLRQLLIEAPKPSQAAPDEPPRPSPEISQEDAQSTPQRRSGGWLSRMFRGQ